MNFDEIKKQFPDAHESTYPRSYDDKSPAIALNKDDTVHLIPGGSVCWARAIIGDVTIEQPGSTPDQALDRLMRKIQGRVDGLYDAIERVNKEIGPAQRAVSAVSTVIQMWGC